MITLLRQRLARWPWLAAGLVDSKISQHSARLELHWAEIAQFRIPTPRVVEALDVVEHIGSGFIAGAVPTFQDLVGDGAAAFAISGHTPGVAGR